MRSGSDAVVKVDLKQFMRDGGRVFWSVNDVFLTEGFADGRIPPKYFRGIFDLYTGENLNPLDAPEADEDGDLPGAEKVHECIISQEEGNRIAQRVGFTREEQEEDKEQVVEEREEAFASAMKD